jgi:hypothetical protein
MTARKLLTHTGSGDLAEYGGVTASAGAASAGDIPALGPTGRLDQSMMPSGVGPENGVLPATEALSAGDWVNYYLNAGTWSCRKADGSASAGLSKRAHGYVLVAVAQGASATTYTDGKNDQCSGLTGPEAYLSDTVPGKAVSTPPTGSGKIVQSLGTAISATEINANIARPILLA